MRISDWSSDVCSSDLAREHGVEVRGVDVNASGWDNSLERKDDGSLALRLGFRQVDGFRAEWAARIAEARTTPFASVEELARRANLPSRALRLLADADACRSMGLDRRPALWDARRVRQGVLPLFGAAEANELGFEEDAALPPTPMAEHVLTDNQTTRLSLKGHPMAFLRSAFAKEGVLSASERSEEHTSELQSLLRSSYAVFCLTNKPSEERQP